MNLFLNFFVLESFVLIGGIIFLIEFCWFDIGVELFELGMIVEKDVVMSFLFWMLVFCIIFERGCELWVIVYLLMGW